jgi:type III pantothenate kinase
MNDESMSQVPTVLACGVGNSRVHFASVRGETVTGAGALDVGELGELGDRLAALWKPLPAGRKLVASSVNPAGLDALEAAAEVAIGEPVLVVGRDVPLPIETDLDDPQSVGTDRVCCAAAAFDRLGVACVVGDFGTAITIDCVSDEGVFLGGAILPGLAMGAAAMNGHAAQLPAVAPAEPDWVFGKDTRQAMVGGLVFGARGALRELTEAYATELGRWPIVILTGGDARLVCGDPNESELVQAIVDDLLLRGVAMAYYRSLVK